MESFMIQYRGTWDRPIGLMPSLFSGGVAMTQSTAESRARLKYVDTRQANYLASYSLRLFKHIFNMYSNSMKHRI